MTRRVQKCRDSFHNRVRSAASFFRSMAALAIIGLACATSASADEFKTYDMMELNFVPVQHRDKGLEKIPVLYMCAMWRSDYIRGVNYCAPKDYDFSKPDLTVVEQRAKESIGLPVVAIDIEGGDWRLTSTHFAIIDKAVANWQALITEWRRHNTDTKILIYGGMPRIAWEIMKSWNDDVSPDFYWQTQQAIKIAGIFRDEEGVQREGVELWPSAYVGFDRPEIFRAERKWQIDICRNVYKTKCYFAITPTFTKYADPVTGVEPFMNQNSFLEIMTTLKEDGADGFGLWLGTPQLSDDYEDRMRDWSWSGGAIGIQRDQDLMWMSAVERFLDAHIADESNSGSAEYCVDTLLATADSYCEEEVSRRLRKWPWLKRYLRTN